MREMASAPFERDDLHSSVGRAIGNLSNAGLVGHSQISPQLCDKINSVNCLDGQFR